MSTSLKRLAGETVEEYINRLICLKDTQKLTWLDITHIANEELGLHYSESWYRKNYKDGKFCSDVFTEVDEDSDSVLSQIDDKIRQMQLAKTELCDLVSSNNAMLRRMSREQTILDIAHDYANVMSKSKPLLDIYPTIVNNNDSDKEGILLLSDWHYGLVTDNYWNTFDPDVCTQRVHSILCQTLDAIQLHKLKKLTVLDLSDLIAGRIHTQIRIESRFDVITQTMTVAEILAEFLNVLAACVPVDFYSCLDNHSRIESNKKESMDLESLTRIIPWYLKERLSDNKRINICSNEFGEDIITCTVAGHAIAAVHGHDDVPSTAMEKLSLFTSRQYALICMAHRHHMWMDEQYDGIVLCNGCLSGVDTHTKKLRLKSKPSQTLIIATPSNVIADIKRLSLD